MTPRSGSVPVAGKPVSAVQPSTADRPVVADESVVALKPRALARDGVLLPFSPASPAERERTDAGIAELSRLGFRVANGAALSSDGYFAGSIAERRKEFLGGLERSDIGALVGVRGGYGSNYLLDDFQVAAPVNPKIVLGFSDLTSLQIYLWQHHRWVTFYGPMLAAGFEAGEGAAKGYDRKSLLAALQNSVSGWQLNLQGEVMQAGDAQGRLLGGCLTLVETTIGTPWELETSGAILLLEDRGMKPWQVDRALTHLQQAGKFRGLGGIVLGDFPECAAPVAGSPTVRDVCQRILAPLGIPVIFGAPLGHTDRPMLTLPLGVSARLSAKGEGVLEILEPAVVA
jgi:muramoyltetrapeptide carboxypeptidase